MSMFCIADMIIDKLKINSNQKLHCYKKGIDV